MDNPIEDNKNKYRLLQYPDVYDKLNCMRGDNRGLFQIGRFLMHEFGLVRGIFMLLIIALSADQSFKQDIKININQNNVSVFRLWWLYFIMFALNL